MNGVHDMGGMHGFGKVEPEPDEPVFHAPWEGRVLAMNRAMGYLGLWSIDVGRFSRETLPPHVYLGSSYYKKWTLGLESLCMQFGLVGDDELAAGHALHSAKPVKRVLTAVDTPKTLARGSFDRPPPAPAKFKPGDRVRTRNINPPGHTRLPRYARGHSGVVECVRGCHVFPDAIANGQAEDPHWLYTVVFDGRELWGEAADPTVKVSIEAWEPYLEAA
jgi:nitrile hydratase subunit beta